MDRQEIMGFFNKRPRNCLIITSNGKGDVNVAVFGSPRMIDENTIVAAVRQNRTYQNLRQNPKAAIIVMEPNEITHDSKAIRVYLELIAIQAEGELLDQYKKEIAARAGQVVADAIQAALRFKITDVRSLIDPL